MKSFFNEVLELLAEGQSLELKLTKTQNQLTVLATGKGKLFTATGTPEEFEEEFFPTLQKVIEEKKFSFNIVETKPTEKEVEEEEEAEEVKETTDTGKGKASKDKKKKEVKPKEEAPVVTPIAEAKEVEPVVSETPEASQEPEKKVEEPKAEAKPATAKDANKEKVFKLTMDEGAKLFAERQYASAQEKFQEALKLFPDNKLAITEEAKAGKWAKMVAEL